jgi:hypothetical protein
MNFKQDLRRIALEKLTAAGIAFDPKGSVRDLWLALLVVQQRLISNTPRAVYEAPEFVAATAKLPPDERDAVIVIERKIRAGENVNPHLNERSLIPEEDDDLVVDWAIYHFHLSLAKRRKANGRFLPRTGLLAFAHITPKEAYMVDIRGHRHFEDPDLLETLFRRFPLVAQAHEMRGVIGTAFPATYSAKEVKKFRKAHVNVPIQIDGKLYLQPGSGFVASGHSVRAMMQFNAVLSQVQWFERVMHGNDRLVRAQVAAATNGAVSPSELDFDLVFDQGEWLVHEKKTDQKVRFLVPIEHAKRQHTS